MTKKNLTPTELTPTELTPEAQRELILEQRKAKFKVFAKLWVATAKLNSTAYAEPDETDVSIVFSDLEKYSIEEIKSALQAFRKMPERRLTPAIIESLITGISWLTPAEAWAIAQKMFDDSVSVVLTDEIAEAAGSAKVLYLDNQRVAAKDDFIAVYNRLMLKAVAENKKPRWFLMQSDFCHDRQMENKRAIQDAFQNGYISHVKASRLAESFGVELPQGNLQKLIVAAPSDEIRGKLQGLKKMLVNGGEK